MAEQIDSALDPMSSEGKRPVERTGDIAVLLDGLCQASRAGDHDEATDAWNHLRQRVVRQLQDGDLALAREAVSAIRLMMPSLSEPLKSEVAGVVSFVELWAGEKSGDEALQALMTRAHLADTLRAVERHRLIQHGALATEVKIKKSLLTDKMKQLAGLGLVNRVVDGKYAFYEVSAYGDRLLSQLPSPSDEVKPPTGAQAFSFGTILEVGVTRPGLGPMLRGFLAHQAVDAVLKTRRFGPRTQREQVQSLLATALPIANDHVSPDERTAWGKTVWAGAWKRREMSASLANPFNVTVIVDADMLTQALVSTAPGHATSNLVFGARTELRKHQQTLNIVVANAALDEIGQRVAQAWTLKSQRRERWIADTCSDGVALFAQELARGTWKTQAEYCADLNTRLEVLAGTGQADIPVVDAPDCSAVDFGSWHTHLKEYGNRLVTELKKQPAQDHKLLWSAIPTVVAECGAAPDQIAPGGFLPMLVEGIWLALHAEGDDTDAVKSELEAAVRRTVQGLGSISSALLTALDAPLGDLLERQKDTGPAGPVGATIGKLVAEAAEQHQAFLAPRSA